MQDIRIDISRYWKKIFLPISITLTIAGFIWAFRTCEPRGADYKTVCFMGADSTVTTALIVNYGSDVAIANATFPYRTCMDCISPFQREYYDMFICKFESEPSGDNPVCDVVDCFDWHYMSMILLVFIGIGISIAIWACNEHPLRKQPKGSQLPPIDLDFIAHQNA